jgi:hypothetical protein
MTLALWQPQIPTLGPVGFTSVRISALLAASGSGLVTICLVSCEFLRLKYCRVMNSGISLFRSEVPTMMSCSACRTSASKYSHCWDIGVRL